MSGHPTLRERIADRLREAIIKGHHRPGERLQEIQIAAEYTSSRTPVREAFRQLESEGFLHIRSRRGAVVAPITERDVRDFYEIKAILESHAARKALPNMSSERIELMDRLNQKLEELYHEHDISGMIDIHNRFHEVFVEACGNQRLVNLIQSLVKQFLRFRIALSHTPAMEDNIRLHHEIVEAFRSKNEDAIGKLVAENASHGAELLIASLRS